MNPDRPRRGSSACTERNDPRLLAMCCAALAVPLILILALLENTPVVWLSAVVFALTCVALFVLLKGRGSRPRTGRRQRGATTLTATSLPTPSPPAPAGQGPGHRAAKLADHGARLTSPVTCGLMQL